MDQTSEQAKNKADAPAGSGNDLLLQVTDLRVRFRIDKTNSVEAVKGISFDIPKNTTVALVGESGSGKSVSSLAIMGLLAKDTSSIAATSRITFEGRDLLGLSPAERRKLCTRTSR